MNKREKNYLKNKERKGCFVLERKTVRIPVNEVVKYIGKLID